MKKKKKSYKRKVKREKTHAGVKIAAACAGIMVCLVLFCSCLSFDIGDWPSPFVAPNNAPTQNWCGWVGAACAYYMLYYIGPGAFVVLVAAICSLIVKITGHPKASPIFRAIGLALLMAAVSVTFQCLWPYKFFGFPMGSGGVLGTGVAGVLQKNFAWLGTLILVCATWVVGFLLLADSFVMTLLGIVGYGARTAVGFVVPAWSVAKSAAGGTAVVSEIWRRLSVRQKPMVVRNDLSRRPAEPVVRPVENIAVKTVTAEKPTKPKVQPVRSAGTGHVQPTYDDYELPPLDLLAEAEYGYTAVQEKVVKAKATALEKLLGEFNVNARVVAADTGPVVTMFELELGAGVKVSHISGLANDMARAMGVGAVRVVAPLPGRHTIGIEVPNSQKEKVRIKSMMQQAVDAPAKMHIPLYLGKDSAGDALVSDLTKMPHLLIAGTTGSGKSICINSIISGILLTKRPDEVKMILIDPKMVEMTAFNTIPHLMCPIVTETKVATQILEWATVKMDERYALLAEAKVKNIADYNKLGPEEIASRFKPSCEEEDAQIPKQLPYIVIIIDELADLMMTAAKEIEAFIVRLAQKSRAVGIHIVLATQRPQATVVTGLIKSNMPTRVGFRVAARMDSRIILDQNGAETLLGEGDMLFLKPGTSDLVRAQGTFMDDGEIKRIVKHLKGVAEPQFLPELTKMRKFDTSEMCMDELFDDAVSIVLETKRGSVSLLQRRLNVGYARASRIIEMMAGSGILGEYKGSQAREVVMTAEEWEAIRDQMDAPEDDEEPYEDADAGEPAYVSEGQREYMATESDDDE